MTENDEVLKIECKEYLAISNDIDFTSTYFSYEGNNEWVDPTTTNLMFKRIMECLEIKPGWAFLDCGSGLGHVLYLAYSYFTVVKGVEIISSVYKKSKENLEKLLPSNSIEIFNCNMFNLPDNIWDEINVFYISSPFQECQNIEKLIIKIIDSIKSRDREIYVIYYYPYCSEVLLKYSTLLVPVKSIHGIGDALIYHHNPTS